MPYIGIVETINFRVKFVGFVRLVHLDRIIFGCCGWGGGDAIGSNNDDNNIGSGKAMGGENNNQQTMRVRVMMATG